MSKKSRYSKLHPNAYYRPAYNYFCHRIIFDVNSKMLSEYIYEWADDGFGGYLENTIKPEVQEWFRENGLEFDLWKKSFAENQVLVMKRPDPNKRFRCQILVGFTSKELAMRFKLAWG